MTENTSAQPSYRVPNKITLEHCAKIGIIEDKPIMFDYWTDSLDKSALIGIRTESGEKLLVKSEDEYTSPISKIYKVEGEFIIITENSIYVVDGDIKTSRIS
jgi:hypothetical protein